MKVTPELERICRTIARRVQDYMSDPQHRAEFEAWYLARYGKPYEWRKTA